MAKKVATKGGKVANTKAARDTCAIRELAGEGKPFKVPVKLYLNDCKPKAERDGDRVGLSTGLVITHYCNELFAYNRDKQHAADCDVAATMLAEFPKRETVQSLTSYRGYYNGGKHGFGSNPGEHTPPNKQVRSFNAEGEMREVAIAAKPAKAKAKAKAKGKAKGKAE